MFTKIDDDKLHHAFSFLGRPVLWRKVMRNNSREFGFWALFLALVIVGYKFFSDGTFSAVLTLSSVFQCFAFVFILAKMIKQSTASGISIRSLQLFFVGLVSRLLCNLFYHVYLPVDRSGDWIYQFADILSVLLIVLLCWLIWAKFNDTYKAGTDGFNCSGVDLLLVGPLVTSGALALFFGPSLAGSKFADFCWAFGLYVESLAMLPQLILMSRAGGEVEALTSHYVASVAASKLFACQFWLYSYKELAAKTDVVNLAGAAVIAAYLFQLILFADFVFYYLRSLRNGRRLILSL